MPLTDDAAEQPQAGGVPLPAVSGVVHPGRGQRDAEADGAVELPAPRLHGDDGPARCPRGMLSLEQPRGSWAGMRAAVPAGLKVPQGQGWGAVLPDVLSSSPV